MIPEYIFSYRHTTVHFQLQHQFYLEGPWFSKEGREISWFDKEKSKTIKKENYLEMICERC
jgi:hypothetical protein